MIAITHVPSRRIEDCQRTFISHLEIDYQETVRQHQAYCQMLENLGVTVSTIVDNREFPDCAFVEDTAIVFDEMAIICSMGTESRRGEVSAIETTLKQYRETHRVSLPATIEGGDVLTVGRTVLIGLSQRTNKAGITAMEQLLKPHAYRVIQVPVDQCLHLKTACTALDSSTLLVNPAWIDPAPLQDFRLVSIPAAEPFAANTLPVNHEICLDAGHVQTADMLESLGFKTKRVQLSEFAKAEAGITCLSILFEP